MQASFSSMSNLGASAVTSAVDANPLAFRKLPTATATSPADALKVGQKFESMFLSEMLQPMFAGIKTDGVFGGGHGEDMYRSLQVDEYAKALTASGGIGIAAAVQQEILRMQEKSHAPAAS